MSYELIAILMFSTMMLMLLTGQRRGAKGFYESVGFSSEDKFAMVMRKP